MIRPMPIYRRNFVAGASYFFTVNLAERRLRLLTDNIDLLRVAFRYSDFGTPLRSMPSLCCRTTCIRFGGYRKETAISRSAGS
jgi:hypothetical protein